MKLFVLGSLNMDLTIESPRLPKQGETILGSSFKTFFGGKGANQAIAAARLGCDVDFIGAVGSDLHGTEVLNNLKDNAINVSGVQHIEDKNTGVAIIVLSNKDNTIILDAGANQNVSSAWVKQYLDKHAKPGDYLLAQLEVPFEDVKDSFNYAKSIGMTTVLNAAPARLLDNTLINSLDYLVVNQTEAEVVSGIYPNDLNDCVEVYQTLSKEKALSVIVTLGTEGSVYVSQDKTFHVCATKVKTVDTTGAGDAYIGTLLYGLIKNNEIEEVLQLSSLSAAKVCMEKGAQTALPSYEELIDFRKKMEDLI